MLDLSTSPVICSHFTLGIQKSHFQQYYSYAYIARPISDYLRYLRRKQTVINWPTPPEHVTTLTCELQDLKT